MTETLRVLLCEPDTDAAAKLSQHLASHGIDGDLATVLTVDDISAALTSKRWDIVLCAHSLPEFDARRALDLIRSSHPDLPIVILSNQIEEASAAAMIVAGARDIVSKSDLSRLVPVIRREMEASRLRQNLVHAAGRAQLHFRNIVESSLQGIIVRANSKTQFVNPAFCRMFGYSHDEMMNLRSMTELHPESERGRIENHVRNRYGGDLSVYEYEVQGVRKDGSIFWCSKMASHVEWDGQSAIQVIVVDITERKKAEQKLAEKERQYRETFENAPVAMVRVAENKQIIEANDAFANLLGHRKEELIGVRIGDLAPKEDLARVAPQLKQVWDHSAERIDVEHKLKHKDGHYVWVVSSACLTPAGEISDGRPQLLAQFQDITARREAEAEVARREALYRNLIENSIQGILIVDNSGKPLYANSILAGTFGYTPSEILALDSGMPLYHPEERPKLLHRLEARKAGDQTATRYECRGLKKDGTPFWLELLAASIEWNGQQAVQIAVIDITDRKMGAELLEAREKKYRQTFENAPVAMFRVSRDRTVLDVNQAFEELLGYSREEFSTRTGFSLIHPDDAETVRRRTALVWAREMDRAENEYRMFRKDGRQIWVASCGRLTPDENGVLNHLIVQVQDITDRKIAEENLQKAQALLAQSEKQYRELFDNAPVPMSWIGPDGNYIRVNAAAQRMLGYSAEELSTMRPADTVIPERREQVFRAIMHFASGNGSTDLVTAETPHIRKDGRRIWVSTSISLTRDENGAPRYLLGQLQDITDRRTAEAKLHEAQQWLEQSEKKYRELFEHSPVAVCAISLNGDFLQTNQAYRDLLGYSEEEILRMHPADTVHPSQREMVQQAIMGAVQKTTPERVSHDIQLIRKDGRALWVWLSSTVVLGERGEKGYLLAHLQDITARKTAEAQLFQSQKMEALGNLAGGIAHDFNNMLLPIIGLTELTKEELPTDSPVQENLDTVIEAAEKARQIVRQILTFSRQDQSELKPVVLSDCLGEAISLLRNVLPSTIRIVERIDTGVGVAIADAAQLHSIVLNLGSNAAHAMEGKVGEITIELARTTPDSKLAHAIAGLAEGTAYARLRIRDTGCGIPADRLDKIFNPFFTTKAVGEGTGLGLSMVHGIVERLGGEISVTSEIGKGSCFDIYVPLLRSPGQPDVQMRNDETVLA